MRTYDKLIATILARQAKGDLRPLPGASLALNTGNAIGQVNAPQDIG